MILYDTRWFGSHGIGRFAREVRNHISSNNIIDWTGKIKPTSPIDVFYLTFKVMTKPNCIWFSPGYNAPFFGLSNYILTIHDLNHIDIDENSNFLKKLYYKIVLKKACLKALKILTVSEFSKNRIIEWAKIPEDKVVNVGNGISEVFNKTSEPINLGYEYFLCVSNRKEHKNEKSLVSAFAKAEIESRIKLVFTGDVDEGLYLHAKSLGINNRITFLGRVPENDLPGLYRGSIALLFPSLYEGFGLPIVEAMACSTPVITSNVTSMPEVAGDAAMLVSPYSEEEISSAIEKIISDEGYKQELINKGLQQAQKFSWNKVAKKVAFVLSEFENDIRVIEDDR